MQDPKVVLSDILNCSTAEVDMLLKTKIDIGNCVQALVENGYEVSIRMLYYEAFINKILDCSTTVSDFDIWYNGTQDTHIYICNGMYDWYKENCPEMIDDIEDYMDMEFEEGA